MSPVSLVTGATGFVGINMVQTLQIAGHTVIATDLPALCAAQSDDLKRGRFSETLRKLGVKIIPADLTNPKSLDNLTKGTDNIFHIAGVFSYSAPLSLLQAVNVDGTRNLLEETFKHAPNARIVVWGAGGIYKMLAPCEMLPQPLNESSPKDPANNYILSKWQEEELAMKYYREKGLRVSAVRPFTIYGPYGVYGGAEAIMQFAKSPMPAIPRNFVERIPFSHVTDVCKAALFISEKTEAIGESYNVVDDTQYSAIDLCTIVAEARGKKARRLPGFPVRALRKLLMFVAKVLGAITGLFGKKSPLEYDMVKMIGTDHWHSNAKLKSLGYNFTYPDARVGVAETVKWYEQQGWL